MAIFGEFHPSSSPWFLLPPSQLLLSLSISNPQPLDPSLAHSLSVSLSLVYTGKHKHSHTKIHDGGISGICLGGNPLSTKVGWVTVGWSVVGVLHGLKMEWRCTNMTETRSKDTYQTFLWVLIDLIIGFLGLILKSFGNQTESWSWLWSPLIIRLFEILDWKSSHLIQGTFGWHDRVLKDSQPNSGKWIPDWTRH